MATYDDFAEAFDLHASTGAYNAHHDRPALLGLAGEVTGLTILDTGRGAEVIGVDASAEIIRIAEQRLAGRASFRVHDLEAPLG